MKGFLSKISKSSLKRRSYHFLSNSEPDRLLGHYLAGLIEGDGSIIVPKTITLRALRALGCFARNQKGNFHILLLTYHTPLTSPGSVYIIVYY